MNQLDYRRSAALMTPAGAIDKGASSFTGGAQPPSMLAQYLSIARRRKWVIIGSIAGMLLLGIIATLLMTPRYTASSTLEIQRETRNFTSVQGADNQEAQPQDLEFYETQYGLLRARSLADRVSTELRLYDNVGFFESFGSRRATQWFQDGRPVPGLSTREQRIREAGDLLLRNFQVVPIRLSRLVEISFTSPDPQLAKRVVDTWGRSFIQMTLERRFEATAYARNFLEQRLGQLRTRIDESERRLVDYAAREGIINLPATTPAQGEAGITGERSVVADDLATINRELARATADRIQAQSRLSAPAGTVTEALQNDAISTLRGRRAELRAEYARMMVQFEPDYPPARALLTQIQQLERAIGQEENRVSRSLRETYSAASQRENALRQRVDQLQSSVLDLRRRSIQYNIFERDVGTNRQLYEALLQRYKEIGIAGGVGVNNIALVDAAELPERPSSPKLLLNILAALIVGIALGVGAALALEQIDEGIADPATVADMLGVPLLGTVPKLTDEDPMAALEDRKSSLTEAYLSLQTNLSFVTDHGMPKSIAITSSEPQEGKSTTSFALAQLLARSNRRTVLVDGDMRSPGVHHIYGYKNDRGLSNFLAGDDELHSMVRNTPSNSLSVLLAGPQPPNAAELLSSERLSLLISLLLKDFDHVVIDAPPVMGLADAPLIASAVEGAVFVIESHRIKKGKARVAIARLTAVGASMAGVVLTKFDAKRAHYGYGYDYGYGYGYGKAAQTGE